METKITRKAFLSQVGIGAAAVILPMCLGGVTSCKKKDSGPKNIDFTLDISNGSLATNGGYLVKDGVIVARTTSGSFIAVAAACTHEGTNVYYSAGNNNFVCPNHNATFDSAGNVTNGPAKQDLKQYQTSLNGNSLRVFS